MLTILQPPCSLVLPTLCTYSGMPRARLASSPQLPHFLFWSQPPTALSLLLTLTLLCLFSQQYIYMWILFSAFLVWLSHYNRSSTRLGTSLLLITVSSGPKKEPGAKCVSWISDNGWCRGAWQQFRWAIMKAWTKSVTGWEPEEVTVSVHEDCISETWWLREGWVWGPRVKDISALGG